LSGQKLRGRGISEWDARKERGSRLALRFLVWGIRAIGYRRLRLLLAPIAVYYWVFATSARRASQAYLAKIATLQGRCESPTLRETYRHIYSFAEVILDRLSLWSGSIDDFEIEIRGRDYLEKVLESKRGAFLVGAHIGSFDVLRVVAREADIPVNVVMYSENAERINDAFETLDPECNVRVINADPTSVKAGFEVRTCIERGEFVAMAGDRILPGMRSRVAYANFLGQRAGFPKSPFLLPLVLRVPVILTIAIRTGPRAYDVYFEPLADEQALPSRHREEIVQERVERFAALLERHCMKAPLQWFNFYDFWEEVTDDQR
jgi:predicted LPLAT superfamily acyltransferase